MTETLEMDIICVFCGGDHSLMFPIDGADKNICGPCLIETVHEVLMHDGEAV